MNSIDRWIVVVLVMLISAAAQAGQGPRVYLLNDARLVQTVQGDVMKFRCEQMGNEGISVRRWIRDCNTLARMELQSMKREGRLGDSKVERVPLGDKPVNDELVLTLPTRPGARDDSGLVADP
ncbi:MAG: hypothetical protein SGI99_09210 [Pseudomonadota bacterium]|nr:hypothetical protein [Pseudomonadota bacterium]